jgi:hypothetical protein
VYHMPKYLYCVTKEDVKASCNGLTGIEDSPVDTVNHEGLFCVVSNINATNTKVSRDAALAHERVLEHVMERTSIIPIAFGHVVKTDEDITTKLLGPHRTQFEEKIDYLSDKIELSLKAIWMDLPSELKNIASTHPEIVRLKAKSKLSRNDAIRAGEIAVKELGRKRESLEEDIMKQFGDVSIDCKKSTLFGDAMITNLAFLIHKSDLPTFDSVVDKCDTILGDSIRLKYTGPVPPYNFVSFHIGL